LIPTTLNLSAVKDPADKQALSVLQQASQQYLQNDQNSISGQAIATVINASANQFVYFTGPNTTAYANLTAFSISLLSQSSSASARTAIGLGGGLSVSITTAKLTSSGTNGTMVFTNGILTSQSAAT